MIVGDFHVMGVVVTPYEADPPLIVNPYAVLPFSIPFNASRRLLGGSRKSCRRSTASSVSNFRRATRCISGGNFREIMSLKIFSVSSSLKLTIIDLHPVYV